MGAEIGTRTPPSTHPTRLSEPVMSADADPIHPRLSRRSPRFDRRHGRPRPPSPSPSPPTRSGTSLAFPSLFLLPLLASCGGAPEAPPPPPGPAPVRVTAVVEEVLTRPVSAPGTLGPQEAVPLSFSVGGVLLNVAVDEGDRVVAGQILASLDPIEIDAAVARARSSAEKAERDVARMTRLHADSVIPLAQLQDAQTGVELARAELEAALFNRRYAVITAPAAGTILRRASDAGARVLGGTPVLVLGTGKGGVLFRAGLPDRDHARVRTGDHATVHFAAHPGRTFTGRVERLGAAADPGTGSYAVEVLLADGVDLPTGLVGRVEIQPAASAPMAVIPVEALLDADGARGRVLALSPDGSRVQLRSVTIALMQGGRVGVSDGLEGVGSVVTAGGAWLNDGDPVRVTP